LATPFFSADLVDVARRPETFLALPGRRFAARFFGLMARSTLPAAFLAPAAATFSLLLAVRFALPMALFASTSVAFARLHACWRPVLFGPAAFPRAWRPMPRPYARFTSGRHLPPCLVAPASQSSSNHLPLRIIDSPVRSLRCVVDIATGLGSSLRILSSQIRDIDLANSNKITPRHFHHSTLQASDHLG
jgi:hypothetical protein